jgi:hypothetical protein
MSVRTLAGVNGEEGLDLGCVSIGGVTRDRIRTNKQQAMTTVNTAVSEGDQMAWPDQLTPLHRLHFSITHWVIVHSVHIALTSAC